MRIGIIMDHIGAVAAHSQAAIDRAAIVENEAGRIVYDNALRIARMIDRQRAHAAGREWAIQIGVLLDHDIEAAKPAGAEPARITVTDNRIARCRRGGRTIGKRRFCIGEEKKNPDDRYRHFELRGGKAQ